MYLICSSMMCLIGVATGTIGNSPIASAGAFVGAGLFGIAAALAESKHIGSAVAVQPAELPEGEST